MKADSDFKYHVGDYHPPVLLVGRGKLPEDADLKTVDQVVHERMAQRPFVTYEQFDVAEFPDYGKLRYDKHEADPPKAKKRK
jgi:hypothetical protein